MNKDGEMVKNKERLVCKGYAKEEAIDYRVTFTLVARLEGVRILLAFKAYNNFKLFHVDLKFELKIWNRKYT